MTDEGSPRIGNSATGPLFIASGIMFAVAGMLGEQLAFYGVGAMFVLLGIAALRRRRSDA